MLEGVPFNRFRRNLARASECHVCYLFCVFSSCCLDDCHARTIGLFNVWKISFHGIIMKISASFPKRMDDCNRVDWGFLHFAEPSCCDMSMAIILSRTCAAALNPMAETPPPQNGNVSLRKWPNQNPTTDQREIANIWLRRRDHQIKFIR